MSLLCCCSARAPVKPPRLKDKSARESYELVTLHPLPNEVWEKVLKFLPLHTLWRKARPVCRHWNRTALDIVWSRLVDSTIIDVQWQTSEKRIRQRLYPILPRSPETLDCKPFSTIARWNLPEFEMALYSAERGRYKCTNVILLLPSGKTWQNVALFALTRSTATKDLWEFAQFSGRGIDLNKEFFELSWLARWRVTYCEGEERKSTSSRGDMHLDHVTVPLAQFVKLAAFAEEEEWPNLARIDGFDRTKGKSRPNSGISTPRRRSEPNID